MKRAILYITNIAPGSRVGVFHNIGIENPVVLFNEIAVKPTLRIELPMLHKLIGFGEHDKEIFVRVRDTEHVPGEWTRAAEEEIHIDAWRPEDRLIG